MPDPLSSLEIGGYLCVDTSGGYTRLCNPSGPQTRFIGAETIAIDPPLNGTLLQFVRANVPLPSRLAISDYPTLPPPIILKLKPGLIFPEPLSPRPLHSSASPHTEDIPRPGPINPYKLTDGTALTVNEEDGIVTGLSGTAANGIAYSLTGLVSVFQADGRTAPPGKVTPKVTWLGVRFLLTKGNDNPFFFGFSYSAEAFLFNVFSGHANLENFIQVDVSAAVVDYQGQTNGYATLTRHVHYYTDTYVSQSLQVPSETIDAGFHFANQATMWPFLPDVELFSQSLSVLASSPPEPSKSPFITLGSLNTELPPPAIGSLNDQIVTSIVPAFAPLACSCLSPGDKAAGLGSATAWLADLLMKTSTGKAALQTFVQAYYKFQVELADHSGAGSTKPIQPKPIKGDDSWGKNT